MKYNMTLEEAKEAIKTDTPDTNYLCISFGWNSEFILPYKDGLAMLASMAHVEKLSTGNKNVPIESINSNNVSASIITANYYRQLKMATLMGIPYSKFQELISPPIKDEDLPF